MKRTVTTDNRCRDAVLMALLCILSTPVAAHEVRHEISAMQAMTVRLVYADGEPFSYENYELYADGSQRPAQTGRTDAKGRVVFLPDQAKSWHLRAFSADGHGVDLTFDTKAGDAQIPEAETGRHTRLLLGLSIILALFGALQLFFQKKYG